MLVPDGPGSKTRVISIDWLFGLRKLENENHVPTRDEIEES